MKVKVSKIKWAFDEDLYPNLNLPEELELFVEDDYSHEQIDDDIIYKLTCIAADRSDFTEVDIVSYEWTVDGKVHLRTSEYYPNENNIL